MVSSPLLTCTLICSVYYIGDGFSGKTLGEAMGYAHLCYVLAHSDQTFTNIQLEMIISVLLFCKIFELLSKFESIHSRLWLRCHWSK